MDVHRITTFSEERLLATGIENGWGGGGERWGAEGGPRGGGGFAILSRRSLSHVKYKKKFRA
jgi:hypothetical protein